jgi:DNA-binding YbaB/EbfC family protein
MAGFGDILKLMSHAKELQAGAEKMKDELPKMEFTSTAANGGVSVTVGGDFTVRNITISPEMLNDKAFLENELRDALNSAYASARSAMQEKMREVTGALGIELPTF